MTKMNLMVEPGKQEICSTRVYDAPLELVFKVYTDPKHIPNWWGPRRLTTVVETMDVKAGGSWRFIQRDQDGNEFAFRGVYHSVTPLEQVVGTFEFEGTPGHVLLETARFEALPDGKTKMTAVSVFQSVEDRDGMVSAGMESGARESDERFEELLAALQAVQQV